MRIAIMGSGGTGAYYGAKLARAGYDVTFIARGAHLQTMLESGLSVKGEEEFLLHPVKALSDPAGLPPVDVILFAVKTYDTEEAAALIRPIVGPETMILPIQNGVDSIDRLGAVFGLERVVGGLCQISAHIAGPGVIRLNSPFKDIVFGEMSGSPSKRTADFAAALERSGIPQRVSGDIRLDLWKKYTLITALSGITGATRLAMGAIRESEEAFALYGRIAAEVVAVAHAEGVAIDPNTPDKLMKQARAFGGNMKSSLLVDLERGRRLEVETLQGHTVRLGRKHGVPTPVTDIIYALLKLHQPR